MTNNINVKNARKKGSESLANSRAAIFSRKIGKMANFSRWVIDVGP